jgi:glycosyltransferase involved in cell wall biosynthesis
MSILEAYGLGTPAVATRLGGIPELVVDGVTGVIVDPEDPVALAEGIATVASSMQHAAEMGAAGRELVERAFRPDVHLAGLERLYNEAGVSSEMAAS